MQKIIFESHSTSLDNEQGIASGWLDPSLSAKGEEQAKELGKRYSTQNFTVIYVSDLTRSYETARIAFSHRSIPIIQDPRLREWNYGLCNGSPSSEVEPLKIQHVKTPFPKGESLQDVIQRFTDFQKEVLEKEKGPILIIGHRATFYSLEHTFHKASLEDLVTQNWKWQPGWHYSYT